MVAIASCSSDSDYSCSEQVTTATLGYASGWYSDKESQSSDAGLYTLILSSVEIKAAEKGSRDAGEIVDKLGNAACLVLKFYSDISDSELASPAMGQYKPSGTYAPQTFVPGYVVFDEESETEKYEGSVYMAAGSQDAAGYEAVTGGLFTVERVGGVYNILTNLRTKSGETLNFKYSGELYFPNVGYDKEPPIPNVYAEGVYRGDMGEAAGFDISIINTGNHTIFLESYAPIQHTAIVMEDGRYEVARDSGADFYMPYTFAPGYAGCTDEIWGSKYTELVPDMDSEQGTLIPITTAITAGYYDLEMTDPKTGTYRIATFLGLRDGRVIETIYEGPIKFSAPNLR